MTINDKSIDDVLGTRTRGGRMEGAQTWAGCPIGHCGASLERFAVAWSHFESLLFLPWFVQDPMSLTKFRAVLLHYAEIKNYDWLKEAT